MVYQFIQTGALCKAGVLRIDLGNVLRCGNAASFGEEPLTAALQHAAALFFSVSLH